MLEIPVVNIILMITINAAISLKSFNHTLSITKNNTRELSSLTWLSNDGYCRKSAECTSSNLTCFGVPLPYSDISSDVVVDLFKSPELQNFHVSK